jgi:outer membrane immunogenic protein
VTNSANYLGLAQSAIGFSGKAAGFNNGSFSCTSGVTCFTGSSSAVSTGWTAGGGAELRLDQHWSAKIDYQFVDLGGATVRVTALTAIPPAGPSSFNASFRDQFHVVRVGLNYWY